MLARTIGVMSFVVLLVVAGTTAANVDNHLDNFTADLSGANEVDDPGNPEGTGSASVVIDSGTSEVCFTITFDGIEDPVAAHIHQGAAGVNGDVVVDFDWANNPGEGCVAGDPAVVTAIVADPSGHYVNVHTPEFPAGNIRGQLVGELPATGSNLTLYLLLAAAALTVGGAIVYFTRRGHTPP